MHAFSATLEVPVIIVAAVLILAVALLVTERLLIRHQTNLLAYGPGNYRFSDFVKLGMPLNVLAWVWVSVFIPVVWTF